MKDIIAYIELEEKAETGDFVICKDYQASFYGNSSYGKAINLTEIMVGFAEWCVEKYFECQEGWISVNEVVNCESPVIKTTIELLDIYIKEKGIITE